MILGAVQTEKGGSGGHLGAGPGQMMAKALCRAGQEGEGPAVIMQAIYQDPLLGPCKGR